MALLTLRNLGVTRGETLFSNLNLAIGPGDRLGLVAANGRGKSTLLRCLAGTLEPTTGEITRPRGLRIGHVEQDVPAPLLAFSVEDLVRQALPPETVAAEGWRVDVVLDSLAMPQAMRRLRLAELSGGWQRLAMLARIWVADPDLLLLDEPTNHLDLARIAQLEDWLNLLPREVPVVIASHDRAFLDATTGRTLFLRSEESPLFPLPYSQARAALDAADAARERRYQRDIKEAQQLRRQAAKLNNIGINSGSDLLVVKTKQLRQRAERLEDAARPGARRRPSGLIRLDHRSGHAKVLVRLDDAVVATPDGTPLFRTGKRWIAQGDRIVLLGGNGAGKSRLVGLIHQAIVEPQAAASGISATPSLSLGHCSQSLSEWADEDTPHRVITRRFDVGDQPARSLLAGAGIAVARQGSPIGTLSGGQKARLAMLALRLSQPSFYLLDEPTNHLDIEGQEALEEQLRAPEASCLLVSHDRSFIRAVGNRFWLIEKRGLVEIESPEPFFASVASADR